MCSVVPSAPNIGNPAAATAAPTSVGAGHGGGVSVPTATVAGALFKLDDAVSDVCVPVQPVTAMISTVTTAAVTRTPAPAQSGVVRRPPVRARATTSRP